MAMAISLGSKKEFEGCYVQQFWSRNQGQPACFPKKASFMNWMMSGMSRNHYSGGMNILLPAVFMSYQGFDPLPGHVWSPLSKGPVMPGVVAGASKRKDPSASWEAQVSGSFGAAGWKVQGPNPVWDWFGNMDPVLKKRDKDWTMRMQNMQVAKTEISPISPPVSIGQVGSSWGVAFSRPKNHFWCDFFINQLGFWFFQGFHYSSRFFICQ